MAEQRIGLRLVRALKPRETKWDGAVSGFGVRRQNSDVVVYILKYRTREGRRQRWLTIGRHGAPWTPDDARDESIRLLGEVAKGGDPAAVKQTKRKAATVSELCDHYLADAEAGRLLTRRRAAKKESTLVTDRGRIERHIKPLLGRHAVAAVTREDVERFMHDVAEGKTAITAKGAKKRGFARVRGGRGTATRTIGLLGAIFTYATKHRMREGNPVVGVMRYADGVRERRLSEEEYKALGTALRNAEAASIWPAAVGAARFLALTGWRLGEVLDLRWDQVDFNRHVALLPDSKTGRSTRALSHAACDILQDLTHSRDRVFPATRGDGPMSGFPKLWKKIAKLGKLPADVTAHVFRHSFSSLAADLGYSELTIGTLVGHKGHTVTSKYIHSADAVLLAAADAVAIRTAELMGEVKLGGVVVEMPNRVSG
jgi:integrase